MSHPGRVAPLQGYVLSVFRRLRAEQRRVASRRSALPELLGELPQEWHVPSGALRRVAAGVGELPFPCFLASCQVIRRVAVGGAEGGLRAPHPLGGLTHLFPLSSCDFDGGGVETCRLV